MSDHRATVEWKRETDSFAYEDYNREHAWTFGSGTRVEASAASQFLGNAECVDPEEAFVASVSSCHMLTFLAICARKRLIVDRYRDEAVGYLEKNGQGKLAVTRIELSPEISFAGPGPDPEVLEKIHHLSHDECFIANSVVTDIRMKRLS